jgi:hypothetical protein
MKVNKVEIITWKMAGCGVNLVEMRRHEIIDARDEL